MHQPYDFFSVIPDVIQRAAVSPLGIGALLAIILGLLGWVFFKTGPLWAKFVVWLVFFAGAVAFFAVSVATAAGIGVSSALPVSGTVVDSVSNDPVRLAQVSIVGRPETTLTDSNGNFSLEIVQLGKATADFRLRVTKQGCVSYDLQFSRQCPPDSCPPLVVPLSCQR